MYLIDPITLRTLRDAAGLSQGELAEAAGMERRTVLAKEKPNPTRTRAHILRQLAQALNVDFETLLGPLPDSQFLEEPQIFLGLEEALKNGDTYLSGRYLDYIASKLGRALDKANLELSTDWLEHFRGRPTPSPPKTPRWPSYFKRPSDDAARFGTFMREWHRALGESPVAPEYFLRELSAAALHAALEALPVKENGRLNLFRIRAYFRLHDGREDDGLKLARFSDFDRELWIVHAVQPVGT